LPYLELT